ncbi:MAG TPA: hypothetical protein VFG84_07805 [Gemmatimonadaceae bacterium]|nr:hypothetical protein [Gemmatimonadaceae bacterium]
MDSLITSAARALAAGDALGALNRVALRDDAPALVLRGIAMAQLGDLARAKSLVQRAARAFGARETVARARCVVILAELALASRDFDRSPQRLELARDTLEARGDRANAAYARYLQVRRLLMLGRLDDAELALAEIDAASAPPALAASCELVAAGIAMRRVRARDARAALERAARAASRARIPALMAEIERTAVLLDMPAARLVSRGVERPLLLQNVEELFASQAVIVDARGYTVRNGDVKVHLTTRPVLFALARTLGEAWPGDAARRTLIAHAFGSRFVDESHRARLRVEIARLRRALREIAGVSATGDGFQMTPVRGGEIVVLARPVEEQHAALLALVSDGESWSTSALSLVLGAGQRTVQRALQSLVAEGKVQSVGHGRSRRWMARSMPGFTTDLLLTLPLPGE